MNTSVNPRIYQDVPFDEYLAWPCINNTLLHHAARSMAHFRAAEDAAEEEPSNAQQLGSVIHTGVLEPQQIRRRFVAMPDFAAQVMHENSTCKKPRATNRYRQLVEDFQQLHVGKQTVTQEDFDALLGIHASLREHPRAGKYLRRGRAEVSIVWDDPDTGLRCKARLDYWQQRSRRFTDLKTTRDAGRFEKFVAEYGYYRQLAFYADGLETLTGVAHEACLVAAEPSSPYAVRAAPLSTAALDAGRAEYHSLLKRIAECRESGLWPAYDDPDAWELPHWARPSQPVSLSVGGHPVTI